MLAEEVTEDFERPHKEKSRRNKRPSLVYPTACRALACYAYDDEPSFTHTRPFQPGALLGEGHPGKPVPVPIASWLRALFRLPRYG